MDDIDIANKRTQEELDSIIKAHLESVPPMPVGKPGDCDICGRWNGRLVLGACSPCRDKYNLE